MEWVYSVFSGLYNNGTFYLPDIYANSLFEKKVGEKSRNLRGLNLKNGGEIIGQRKTILYKNQLIFIPHYGKLLQLLDLESGELSSIECFAYNDKDKAIADGIILEDTLYLFPLFWGDSLISVNLNSGVCRDEQWFNEWYMRETTKKESVIFARFVEVNGTIFTVLSKTNSLLEIRLYEKSVIKHEIEVNNLFGIWKGDQGFWVSDDMSEYACLLNHNFKIVKKCRPYRCKKRAINQIIEMNLHTYFLPAFGERICSYRKEDGKIEELEYPEDSAAWGVNFEGMKFFGYSLIDDTKCVAYPICCNGLIWIDDSENELSFERLVFENAERCEQLCLILRDKEIKAYEKGDIDIIEEKEFFQLGDFINYVANLDVDKMR